MSKGKNPISFYQPEETQKKIISEKAGIGQLVPPLTFLYDRAAQKEEGVKIEAKSFINRNTAFLRKFK